MITSRKFIIKQIIESWVDHLPVDLESGASIATREDIARLSEQLATQLAEPDERQTDHWLSLLVELYTQAKFKPPPRSHLSNNPIFQ
jgi:hypothetical protein